MATNQIQALPLNLGAPVPFVNAINDRLRKISMALEAASGSTGAAAEPVVYGTHLARVNNPVPADGTIYVESDRNGVAYQVRGTGYVWLFGVYRETQAQTLALAASLGLADAGLLVYSTDALLLYRWSGTAFVLQNVLSPVIVDTHANRLSAYPSTRYAVGQEFWESDRTVRYIVRNCAGTVNTTTTAVTWVSGNKFNTLWAAGTVITIGGTPYGVAAVADATHLTLATSAGTNAGAAFSVASGRWAYEAETMQAAWASLPADLGDADAGFLFWDNTNSLHIWQWTGAAWVWGPGNRASGEMAEFDADPGVGWHLCDGTGSLTKYAADGTRVATFTVPDRRGFYTAGGAYTGTGVAAVPATVTTGSASVNAGTGAAAGPFLTSAAIGTQPVPATFATLYYYRL